LITVSIINKSIHPLPEYATKGAAGMDLRANVKETVLIAPRERKLIDTGLYVSIPEGYEAQIRPRSGLALKHGITVLNSPGTIDSDYRGEIKVLLINHADVPFEINNGDRIAQMVFARVEMGVFRTVEVLPASSRGDGGYGHTGK
jgi:dUTP pyrophosphatase